MRTFSKFVLLLACVGAWAQEPAPPQTPVTPTAPAPAAQPPPSATSTAAAATDAEPAIAAPKDAPAPAVPTPSTVVMKTVEIEWEEVPNAESYIVKLTPKAAAPGASVTPIYFTTKQAKLSEQLPVGLYELRIRSRSKEEDVFSKWSDPAALEVLIKEIKPLSPPDKSTIEAKGKSNETVTFSWTPVEKVKEYTITVWTSDAQDKPFEFKTKNTHKSLVLKTGKDYHWQVQFESATDVSYAQMPPVFHFTVVGSKLIKPLDIKVTKVKDETLITWSASEDAREYKTKLLFHYLDEKDFKGVKDAATKQGAWNVGKLKAGAYRVEVTARAPSRVDSDVSDHEFFVKPTQAELMR